jgi:hypothetical protein
MWVGNLQTGYGYATKVIKWPEADAFVVIAKGATYFIRPNEPKNWVFFDLLGIDCVITALRDIALLSTYSDVIAISTKGTELWRRSVAIDGVEITKVEDGLIYGSAGIDPPDVWHPFLLDLATGNDVKPPNAPGSE